MLFKTKDISLKCRAEKIEKCYSKLERNIALTQL